MKTALTGTSRLLLSLTGLLFLLSFASIARADEGDPPSRTARVSFVEGSVSLQPGGSGDWGAAAQNRPVTIGDKLWVDKDSRAELQVGQAAVHLGSMTALSFLNLDESIMQMRIPEGSVNFRVRELREGDLCEADTPNLAFTVKQAGAFRIDVNENGDATRITVIRGEGEVTAGGQTYPVHAGETAEFNGTDNPTYNVSPAGPPDGLDRWAADRDLREDNSPSANYVSREVPGYSDLDENGSWSEQPDYGPVWYPSEVPVGWAPYSWGYWNWIGPWGWTWVGYEPWGFAPYHYGRWGFIGGRWGWCPGPIFARPFYGPAFVGFLGGPHFGVGFGFGTGIGVGVGWFPLGFREPYFPAFHASAAYITNINVHNTAIRNVNVFNTAGHSFNYAYAHNVNAVTVASHNAFVNGQAINRGATHITAASLRGAEVSNRTSFTATRQSALGTANMSGHFSSPPASVQNRAVMARTAPAAAASRAPVHTMSTTGLTPGRLNSSTMSSARVNQLSQNRPPSANGNLGNRSLNGAADGSSTNRSTGTGRYWAAQGNVTDRGQAPQGFGSSSVAKARVNHSDRPSWAGSGSASSTGGWTSHSTSPSTSSGRPSYSSNTRSYQAPTRSYSAPSRGSSAPSRGYSAPSRSYSAPSHSSGGGSHSGGGGSHGGSAHGGGGGRH